MAQPTVVRCAIIAISASSLLWTTTLVLALTGHGSDRLHSTLLAGSFLAAGTTLAALGILIALRTLRAENARLIGAIHASTTTVSSDLHNAVAQAADEIHNAVAEMGDVLRLDRRTLEATRVLLAELHGVRAVLPRPGAQQDKAA